MLPEAEYLSLEETRTVVVIALSDDEELRLSTEELDQFLRDLMKVRLQMLPPPEFDDETE